MIMRNKKIKKSDEWKYNSEGFFNLTGYLDHLDKNWRNKDLMVMFNAERNMGKSYGTWDHIEKDIWIKSNYTERIAYLRTNSERLKKAIESFNAKYRGKYFMNSAKIFKQTFDDDGKEIISKRIEIGAVLSLNGAVNYKSGIYENYRMVFYDEYNEDEQILGVYEKFIDLLKTVKRFNTPFLILLVGNKVTVKNDIMTNLEIDLRQITDHDNDYMCKVQDDVYFVEIGSKTFAHLHQEKDIVNRLAARNENTDAYLNKAQYLDAGDDNIIIYNIYVKDNNTVRHYFALDDYKFEYGDFIMDGQKHSYFKQVTKIPEGWFAYSLSIIGDMRVKNSGLMDGETIADLVASLQRQAKNKKLWFCSYDAKLILEQFIRVKMKLE